MDDMDEPLQRVFSVRDSIVMHHLYFERIRRRLAEASGRVRIVKDLEIYLVPGEDDFAPEPSSEVENLEIKQSYLAKKKKVSDATQTLYSVRPHLQKSDETAIVSSHIGTQTSVTAMPTENDSVIFYDMKSRLRHRGKIVKARIITEPEFEETELVTIEPAVSLPPSAENVYTSDSSQLEARGKDKKKEKTKKEKKKKNGK